MRLASSSGSYVGRARIEEMKPGNLEVHWPEGNVLLAGDRVDPDSLEPDYNAEVTVEPSSAPQSARPSIPSRPGS